MPPNAAVLGASPLSAGLGRQYRRAKACRAQARRLCHSAIAAAYGVRVSGTAVAPAAPLAANST
jgi:hypothetical protein